MLSMVVFFFGGDLWLCCGWWVLFGVGVGLLVIGWWIEEWLDGGEDWGVGVGWDVEFGVVDF